MEPIAPPDPPSPIPEAAAEPTADDDGQLDVLRTLERGDVADPGPTDPVVIE